MYRTLLIDDEPLALKRLERLLNPFDTIRIVGTAEDGLKAVKAINELKPDLIFLDIQMPGLSGFDVLTCISHNPWIIFCTAYDEYALRAFETLAVDYLLKPVEPERLQKSLDKLTEMTDDQQRRFESQMKTLVSQMTSKRVPVKIGDRVRLLNAGDICFFRASEKMVEVHTPREVYLLENSLRHFEIEFPQFIRIHRSALINPDHLDEIVKGFAGRYWVKMKDKSSTELAVSRQGKSRLLPE